MSNKLATKLENLDKEFWSHRLLAFLVDVVIIWIVYKIIQAYSVDLVNILEAPIYYGYFVLSTRLFNTTLGQKIFHLKVVNEDGSTKLSIWKLLLREFCIFSLIILVGIIIFFIKGFWWDKLFHFKVIQVKDAKL